MNRFTSVALVCAATCAAMPALASSQATAQIENLTFTLYDLNPTDGIAPSFQFLTGAGYSGSTTTSVSAADSVAGDNGSEALTRAKPFLANTADITLDNALALASVQQYSVAAHGQAAGPSTSFSANASSSAGNNGYVYSGLPGGIEVSANSLLVIRATGSVSATADGASSCSYYYCYSSDSASASVSMSLSFNNSSDGTNSGSGSFTSQLNASAQGSGSYVYQYDPLSGYYQSVYVPGPTNSAKSDVLSVVFANNTDLTQRAFFSVSASVSGTGYSGSGVGPVPELPGAPASPVTFGVIETTADFTTYGAVTSVPEPATWLTMVMGLAGLSFAVARQRRAV